MPVSVFCVERLRLLWTGKEIAVIAKHNGKSATTPSVVAESFVNDAKNQVVDSTTRFTKQGAVATNNAKPVTNETIDSTVSFAKETAVSFYAHGYSFCI
jgi:hypothetical protein